MDAPLLALEDITKRFPGVLAVDRARLEVHAGEVHGLVGENGAGKSTLMRILAGVYTPDAGTLRIDGRPVRFRSPHDAQAHGVAMIHQEFNLVPALSVAENIFLGREPVRGPLRLLHRRRMRDSAGDLLNRLRMPLDVRAPIHACSVAQQQMVEIARAVSMNARILVMDEPTATLTGHEIQALTGLIWNLRASGIGIVYISHRLNEILTLCGRVTVMRDGQTVSTRAVEDTDEETLVRDMVGRELSGAYPKTPVAPGPELLRVEALRRGARVRDVSFHVRAGEVVGFAGLVGAGRTETARAVFGADQPDGGAVLLDGRRVRIRRPRDAVQLGMALLPESRKEQGLVLGMTIRENITLARLAAFCRAGVVMPGPERAAARGFAESLRIKAPSIEQTVQNLSGGNQQKVVLAKWLLTEARVVVFDEPTRGLDIGAKAEIHRLIDGLAQRGKGVVLISSELPELLGLADRVYVMREGRIAGELPRTEATQERVMQLATGAADAGAA